MEDSPVVFNADNSLLLCGVWRNAATLFERMEAEENFDDSVKIISERTKEIIRSDSKYNKLIIADLEVSLRFALHILFADILALVIELLAACKSDLDLDQTSL